MYGQERTFTQSIIVGPQNVPSYLHKCSCRCFIIEFKEMPIQMWSSGSGSVYHT